MTFFQVASLGGRGALLILAPLMFAAALFSQQADPQTAAVGTYCHRLSVFCALIVALWFSRHKSVHIAIGIVLAVSFVLSSVEEARTLYLILQMYLYVVCGLVLMRFEKDYLVNLVTVLAVVSLIVMPLQLVGWPSWINSWATHGRVDGVPVELHPTLFVDYLALKAVYNQTRAAGIFSSNQLNTVFFFFLLIVAVISPGKNLWRLPLTAAYAVFTLSKAVIFGSTAFVLLAALVYRSEHKRRAFVYVSSLLATFVIYAYLFPGVVETYFAPHTIMVSAVARLLDVLDAIHFRSLVTFISSYSGDAGTAAVAVRDTMRAFAQIPWGTDVTSKQLAKTAIDYGSLGSLTFISQMARAPLLTGALVVIGLAVAVVLNRKKPKLTLRPVDLVSGLAVVVVSMTMPVATLQVFWLYFGLATVAVYGPLVDRPSAETSNGWLTALWKRPRPS
jgi:hypothetical protein